MVRNKAGRPSRRTAPSPSPKATITSASGHFGHRLNRPKFAGKGLPITNSRHVEPPQGNAACKYPDIGKTDRNREETMRKLTNIAVIPLFAAFLWGQSDQSTTKSATQSTTTTT